jgi:hypothetical protein
MVKSFIRFSSLALVGAAACGIGCQDDPVGPPGTGQVELQLAVCDSSPGQIRGCANPRGVLRIISGTEVCLSAEQALCWNQVGPVGPQGANSLVLVTPLPVGDAICPTGGSQLTVGVDVNGDGTLEGESPAFASVCNGAQGPQGEQGVQGEQGIQGQPGQDGADGVTCWDLNGNGTCDLATEDQDGDGICDGADCQGVNSLIRMTSEPAGTNCANGGQKIETGLDRNNDNVLDPGEEEAVAYVCNGPAVDASCPTGFADCDSDGNGPNRCETNITTKANCGGCGITCSSLEMCTAGTCTACTPGYADCDGATDCETDITTTANCGACGNVCSAPNATAACTAGVCTILACNAEYDDCDANSANGCETDINTNTDCGGCGITCNAPQTCGGAGAPNQCGCTPTTCAAAGAICGTIPDGCGGSLDCGTCAAPQTCGGGGTPHVCGVPAPPPDIGGPTMVRLPEGYYIDSTEVTRAQYQAWLNTNPPAAGQISDCTWNTSFAPDATCMSSSYVYQGSGSENHPQVCVDWCDAYAYCQAVGKRLCGKIGGGANGSGDYADASLSQWYNACVSDGANDVYSFGNTYQPTYCNGYDYSVSRNTYTTVAVGSMTSCQSPVSGYEGVYDLSGNVYEWEDSCDGPGGCLVRGGSFAYGSSYELSCGSRNLAGRQYVYDLLGLRCCSP